ncbi:MAG: GGDEF domain-containing protein [Spirochaetes bacterium]|nr:GGDEF domain-containing protein [Spirochaetota bacterium]
MEDERKSKDELLNELAALRRKVTRMREESGLGAVLTSIEDTVFFINGDGIFKYFFGSGSGFDRATRPEYFIGKHFKNILPDDVSLQIESAIEKVKESGHSQDFDYRLSNDTNDEWYNAKLSPFKNERGTIVGITAVVRNITERKHMEESNRQRALHDPLTGLPNRVLFNDRFNLALAQAQRKDYKVALMMVDLDRFKAINDTYGHDAGDGVLVEVGERLTKTLRRSDTVARIGGDEFLLLIPEIHSPEQGTLVATKILQEFEKPLDIHGHAITVKMSIGIAIYPDDVETLDALMKMADVAMYRVKKKGRNNFQRFSP